MSLHWKLGVSFLSLFVCTRQSLAGEVHREYHIHISELLRNSTVWGFRKMPCLGIVNFLMMNRNNLYSYSHPWVSCSCSCSMLTSHTWAVGFIIWGMFQFSPLPTFYVALVITLQVQSSTRLHQVRWYISRKKWIGEIQVNKHVKTTRDGLHLNEVDEQMNSWEDHSYVLQFGGRLLSPT